jgi:hypothetical protein
MRSRSQRDEASGVVGTGRRREDPSDLDEVVRATVEKTLNARLDAEAESLCGTRKISRVASTGWGQSKTTITQQPSNRRLTLNVRKDRALPREQDTT